MKQRIAISLLGLSHKSITGGFVYIENLLNHLFEIDSDTSYYLVLNVHNLGYFKKRYGKYDNVYFFVTDVRRDIFTNPIRAFARVIAKIRTNEKRLEDIARKEIQRFIDKKQINIFFFPASIIYPEGLTNVKTVATVYDLQHKHFPENFSQTVLNFRDERYRYLAKNADHIISISDYTRDEFIDEYTIPKEKITTTLLGPNGEDVGEKITLPKRYIFYLAAFWPHKNHRMLVEALGELQDEFLDLHLVFTGVAKKKRVREELEHTITKYKLENKVHFLGFVSDKELTYIHQHAALLVFPSSFEGFGMPIIEAFKYGVPVIAADNSSITEVVGDAGLLFETGNKEELIQHIKNVLLNDKLREDLIKKGHERASIFSWEKTAEETMSIFDSLI